MHEVFRVTHQMLQPATRRRSTIEFGGDECGGDRRSRQRGGRVQPSSGRDHVADRSRWSLGELRHDFVGHVRAMRAEELRDHRDTLRMIRAAEIDDQTLCEARAQAILERCELVRRHRRGEHHLTAGTLQGVEEVKEFILSPFLSGDGFDVVEQECAGIAISRTPLFHRPFTQRRDQLLGKRERGDAGNRLHTCGTQPVADGVQQVCPTAAGGTGDDERNELRARRRDHGPCRTQRQLVGGALMQAIESVRCIGPRRWLDRCDHLLHQRMRLLHPLGIAEDRLTGERGVGGGALPLEIAQIYIDLEQCSHGQGVLLEKYGENLTAARCKEMIGWLETNGDYTRIRLGLPNDAKVAHKSGWIPPQIQADAGIVRSPGGDFVIAIYMDQPGERYLEPAVKSLIGSIARLTYSYYNPVAAK